MNQSGLHYHYDVPGDDFSQAGAASSAVKQILKQLGLDPQVVRNMSIALYEGEINMVIHAGGGEIDVDIDDEKITAVGLWGVAGITIANGADNISLYTPIFRTSSPGDVAVMIVVFLILVAVWCAAGRLIGTHKAVTETLERVEHWLVPVVFIGLGLFILIESGVIVRLFEALV